VITRRALALALVALAADPARTFAADADAGPLTALAAYLQEVVSGYDALLRRSQGPDHHTLEGLRRRAARAADALPKPPPVPQATGETLRSLIAAEEALVASCYTALQSLSDERHLAKCAAVMADSGRRLVVLRGLARAPLLPRAFEIGTA
jgi:hypothetical protein